MAVLFVFAKRYFLTKEHTFLRIFAFDNEQFMRYNSSIKVFLSILLFPLAVLPSFTSVFYNKIHQLVENCRRFFPAFLLFLRHKTLACYVVGVRVRTFTQF